MDKIYNEIFNYILSNREKFAKEILNKQFEHQPELKSRYSESDYNKCLNDVLYHLSFLAESININNPELFKDYVRWAKVLLQNVNVPTEHFAINLKCINEVLKEHFSKDQSEVIESSINQGLNALKNLEIDAESFIKDDNPHVEILKNYIGSILQGERNAASNLIINYADDGIDIKEIYTYVFEPALKEVGRLWQTNKITVAQEHYFTATTQLIMSQLYSRIFSTKKNGMKFVAACVNDELHEVGIRMVSDILEMDGWDTYYLGANVPKTSVIQFIKKTKPYIVGISATMTFHLHKVIDLIDAIKRDDELKDIKILVGGYPFNVDKELWKKVGADYYAQSAIETSNLLSSII